MIDEIDQETRVLLDRFGFDPRLFASLRERVRSGVLSAEENVVVGTIEPPSSTDLTTLPVPGDAGFAELRTAGLELLRAGRVAQLVLTGGMATRFGGVVKGVVEAVGGRSFLELKIGDTRRLEDALGAEIPVALMTSFATDKVVREHVVERGLGEVLAFHQFVSLRLAPDGDLFRDREGRPSPYAPGHGDLYEAVRRSATIDALRRKGIELVSVSNVDNLGARIDPAVIGAHVVAGNPLTIEVAAKEGDLGGAPVRVNGRLQLLEKPRFPPSFDQDRVPVFNTNTAVFDLAALDCTYDLTWLYVEKDADGDPAVQLERVYHEASAVLPTTYLEVPRRGPRGRFLPIKTPEDLAGSQDDLRVLLESPLI